MRGTQKPGGTRDGANGGGEPQPRPLLRPSPSANLVGNWKGDPLGPQVAAPSGLPNNKPELCLRTAGEAGCLSPPRRDENIAPTHLPVTPHNYIGDGCYLRIDNKEKRARPRPKAPIRWERGTGGGSAAGCAR